MRLELPDVGATEALGNALARTQQTPAIVYLHGDLGAGKSTLARAWLRALGVDGRDPQPDLHTGRALSACRAPPRHCIWTCIGSPPPANWNSLRWTMPVRTLWLVEWPERGAGALPPADLQVDLAVSGAGARGCPVAGFVGRDGMAGRTVENRGLRALADPDRKEQLPAAGSVREKLLQCPDDGA